MSYRISTSQIRGLCVGLALLTLVALSVWVAQTQTSPELQPLGSRQFDGVHYVAGQTYTYQLDLRVASTASLQSGPMEGDLTLSGTLCIDGLDETPNLRLLVRFCEVPQIDWVLNGQDIGAAALSAGDSTQGGAIVVLKADGSPKSLAWLPNTSEAAQNLIHGLIPDIMVSTSGAETAWTRNEVNSLGEGEVRYRVLGWRGMSLFVEKHRSSYTSFHGFGFAAKDHQISNRYAMTLSHEGHLENIEGAEKVEPHGSGHRLDQTSSLSLNFLHRALSTKARPSLTQLEPGTLGKPSTSASSAARLLRNRVGSMTPESFKRDMSQFAPAGTMPGGNKWFWQAEGLLLLHPELALEMVEMFEDPSMNSTARELMMDLLSGAGGPEAQTAMRHIAKGDAIRADLPSEVAMLQRFMFLKDPTQDTLSFLTDYYRSLQSAGRPREEAKRAIGYTLGGLAGVMKRAGLETEAEVLTSDLRAELAGATRMSQQHALVAALGNAGLEADVDAIVDVAEKGDSGVRFAAAIALRSVPNEKARATLVTLGHDRDAQVMRKSIQVLEHVDLTKKELQKLDDGLRGRIGSGPESIDYGNLLLNAIQSQSESSRLARDLAKAFISQSLGDAKMRQQLVSALNS